MKRFIYFGMTVLLAVLSIGFISCSSSNDDDKVEDTSTYSSKIVGTWTISIDEGWEIDDAGQKDIWNQTDADHFLKFYNDGSGTHADDQDYDPFTWTINGNTLLITPTTTYYNKETWTIKSITDTKMILECSTSTLYNKYTCAKLASK
jgi:hypothetical protein